MISKKGSNYQDHGVVVNEYSERRAVDPREFLGSLNVNTIFGVNEFWAISNKIHKIDVCCL